MKIRRNIILFKLHCFFSYLWPLSVLAVVYFEEIAGSYVKAMGVLAMANVFQGVCAIPAGVFSDKIGRKNTLIISSVLLFVGFTFFAIAGNDLSYGVLMAGGIIWGVSEALSASARDALMYETMIELRKEDKYDLVYAGSNVFSQIGVVAGSIIAILVTYFLSLNALAWISVLCSTGIVIVSALFVEAKKESSTDHNLAAHLKNSLRFIIDNKMLQIVGALQIINKSLGKTTYRIEGAYFNSLIATWLVNVNTIIRTVIGALSFAFMPAIRSLGFIKMILASIMSNAFIRTLAIMLNNTASPFIMSLQNIFYGPEITAESALLQRELSEKERATVGSVVTFLICILSSLIYYLAGMIADSFSIYEAIIALIVCKMLVGYFYYLLLGKN